MDLIVGKKYSFSYYTNDKWENSFGTYLGSEVLTYRRFYHFTLEDKSHVEQSYELGELKDITEIA